MFLALAVTLIFTNNSLNNQADLLKPCMAVNSNLPISHNSHPCNSSYLVNQSWWSWASSDNKSLHLHFLNLVELMHHRFY